MHVVTANSAYELPSPNPYVHASRQAGRSVRRRTGLLAAAAQSLAFFAVLWLLAAAPGFLSARDSLVSAGTGGPAAQASR